MIFSPFKNTRNEMKVHYITLRPSSLHLACEGRKRRRVLRQSDQRHTVSPSSVLHLSLLCLLLFWSLPLLWLCFYLLLLASVIYHSLLFPFPPLSVPSLIYLIIYSLILFVLFFPYNSSSCLMNEVNTRSLFLHSLFKHPETDDYDYRIRIENL